MEDTKHTLASLTFWASFFGTAIQVAKIAGLNLPFDDPNVLAGHAVNVVTAVSLLVAFYGRVRATKKLTF
jgi:hypothetical protein